MPGNRTNSNSMTSILIIMLTEDTKFCNKLMKELEYKVDKNEKSRKKSRKFIFQDGTHFNNSYELPDIGNDMPDIIVRDANTGKIEGIIEVKVGINEPLQDSQKSNGSYERACRTGVKLGFIIPKWYYHENELPEGAKILYWDKVKDIYQPKGKQVGTNKELFIKCIEQFVDNQTTDDAIFPSDLIKYDEIQKFITKLKEVMKVNNYEEYYGVDGYGFYFPKKSILKNYPKSFWIGLVPIFNLSDETKKKEFSFSLAFDYSIYSKDIDGKCSSNTWINPYVIKDETWLYINGSIDNVICEGDIKSELNDIIDVSKVEMLFSEYKSKKGDLCNEIYVLEKIKRLIDDFSLGDEVSKSTGQARGYYEYLKYFEYKKKKYCIGLYYYNDDNECEIEPDYKDEFFFSLGLNCKNEKLGYDGINKIYRTKYWTYMKIDLSDFIKDPNFFDSEIQKLIRELNKFES